MECSNCKVEFTTEPITHKFNKTLVFCSDKCKKTLSKKRTDETKKQNYLKNRDKILAKVTGPQAAEKQRERRKNKGLGVVTKQPKSYWLPDGVSLKSGQTIVNSTTKMIFIDHNFGEFETTFHQLKQAGASTHRDAVNLRRKATNLQKYGLEYNIASKNNIEKRTITNLKTYGVENASSSPIIREKVIDTVKTRYGVDNVAQTDIVQEKMKTTNIEKYGNEYPMRTDEVKNRVVETSLLRYGVENPIQNDEIKTRFFESMDTNGSKRRSKGEIEVEDFVKSLGIECKTGFLGGANPIDCDIKINSKNIIIEYNGLFWHSEASGKDRNYHLNKTEKAEKSGYRMIHILDTEWNKRKNQVKSYLKSALGANTNILYGRNTKVEEIPQKEAKEFLDTYHILGSCNFKVAYGLRNEQGLLVNMITLGSHPRMTEVLTLNRFIGREDYTVIGGLSKLCKYAFSINGSFITFVDRRISNGDNWIKSGWVLESKNPPDYLYYVSGTGESLPKHRLKDVKRRTGLSETQYAKENGLYRVWDCGKIRLRYNG